MFNSLIRFFLCEWRQLVKPLGFAQEQEKTREKRYLKISSRKRQNFFSELFFKRKTLASRLVIFVLTRES